MMKMCTPIMPPNALADEFQLGLSAKLLSLLFEGYVSDAGMLPSMRNIRGDLLSHLEDLEDYLI